MYDVWFVPTEKGKEAFSWRERKVNKKPIIDMEDAELAAYLLNCDDPSPDRYEYGKYRVRPALQVVSNQMLKGDT